MMNTIKRMLILVALTGCCPPAQPPTSEDFCLDPSHDGQACDLPEGGKGQCHEAQCVPTPGPAEGLSL
jgi:hypothetical protein